jgi:hypothetical protein
VACATVFFLLQFASACSPDAPQPIAPIAGPGNIPVGVTADVGTDVSLIRSVLAPDKCLTVRGGSTANGTPTELRSCTGGPEQQFSFDPNGELRFQSVCLDAASGLGNPGDAVIVWPCHGGANQKWSTTGTGEIRGINNLCMDVWAELPNDGQPIVVWGCHGGANQKWTVEAMSVGATAKPPAADVPLPPNQQGRLALAFDPASSLSTSSRIGPTGTAVGTPTFVAGPPARYALDPSEAVDFGSGALDNVWTSSAGWTYIAAVQTGAKADAPHYILVKENTTAQFAFFRNSNGGLELVVYTPQPNYENVQTVAVPDNTTLVVAMRYTPQAAFGQRIKLFINGAPATETSHTKSGTGGAVAATSGRLRMGIVEKGSYRASPALGAAYAYSAALTDADVATNSAWVSSNRLWTVGATAPAPVAAVAVAPGSASLAVGGTQQLAATLKDAAGNVLTGRTVGWASSNPAVATVTAGGLVTAVAAGAATVTATSEGQSGAAAVTVAAPVTPPSGGASCSALVADLNARPTSALAKPGYLQAAIEPDFRTTLVRVSGDVGAAVGGGVAGTWPSIARHEYAKDQPWSADGRLLVLKHMQQPGGSQYALFLDGETYQPLFTRGGPPGGGEWRMHPALADVAIYVNLAGPVAGHWNVRTNTGTAKFSTTGYSNARIGNAEGTVSADGRYVAVNATRSSDGRLVVFVIDLVNGTKTGDLDVAAQGVSTLDWASVDQSGGYVMLHGVVNGTAQATKVYSRATLAVVGTWTDVPLGHFDFGKDAAGNDVAFARASSGAYGNRFIARRLDNGAVTPLLASYGYFSYHASARNLARPGWGEASVDAGSSVPFAGEVMWVKADGSGAVQRLAHHRSTQSTYWAQAQGVPSPDGKRVLFASDWGVAGGAIQAYVVDTRPLCP